MYTYRHIFIQTYLKNFTFKHSPKKQITGNRLILSFSFEELAYHESLSLVVRFDGENPCVISVFCEQERGLKVQHIGNLSRKVGIES